MSVDSWAYVPTGNANAMKATLAKQPVAIAIDASHTSFVYYHSGVYYEPNCASDPNDWIMLCWLWDMEQMQWLVIIGL